MVDKIEACAWHDWRDTLKVSRLSGEIQSLLPFLCSRMNTLIVNSSLTPVVAIVEVVEGEGAEAWVRCLHFVLPLAELVLASKVLIQSSKDATSRLNNMHPRTPR